MSPQFPPNRCQACSHQVRFNEAGHVELRLVLHEVLRFVAPGGHIREVDADQVLFGGGSLGGLCLVTHAKV